MKSELEKYLEELGEGVGHLSRARLALFSGLGPEEEAVFGHLWNNMPVLRRRQVAAEVVEIAEDSVELDFDSFFRLCQEDGDTQVRLKAVVGLSLSADRANLSPLLHLLLQDAEEQVRAAAASALGEFVLRAELGELRPGDASRLERALFAVLRDSEEGLEVRRRAVEAISPWCREDVQEIIREAYRSPHLKMKASALYAMGRNCDPKWLPLLLKEMKSPEPELRFEAAKACGEMEDPRATPRLIDLLHDPDTDVQMAAIEALGHIGGGEAKRALGEMLSHPGPSLRASATEALDMVRFGEEPLLGRDVSDVKQDESERENPESP